MFGNLHFTPMSEDQLKAFLDAVKGSKPLQGKLVVAEDSDAVVAIAKEAGFVISVEGAINLESELTDEELENLAGGGFEDGPAGKAESRGHKSTCMYADWGKKIC